MSRSNVIFLKFVLIVVIIGAIVGLLVFRDWHHRNLDNKITISNDFQEPVRQLTKNRLWHDLSLEPRFILDHYFCHGSKHLFSLASSIKVSAKGDIYVFDIIEQAVIRFSNNGDFLSYISRGKGEGPGEFKNITDFEIDENDNIWFCDGSLNRITQLNLNNEVLNTYTLSYRPHRIAPLQKNMFVANVSRIDQPLFCIYNRDAELLRSFGYLLPEQKQSPFFAEGIMVVHTPFIYFGLVRVNILAKYNLNGKLLFLRKTIDDTPLPKLIMKEISGQVATWIDPKTAQWVTVSLSVDENRNNIYHLCGVPERGLSSTIDVYDADDGDYHYSIKLPEKVKYLYVYDNAFYAAQDTVVKVWSTAFIP